MSGYSQRVRAGILPHSVADTLPAAIAEWAFTKSTVDHESPTEPCELCGQHGLHYHFEIANQYTEATLWVGSHCILQFDVAVVERGRRLSPEEAKRHLAKLTQKMQLVSCVRALERLASRESSPISCRCLLETSNPPDRAPPVLLSGGAPAVTAHRGSTGDADQEGPPLLGSADRR